MEKKFHINEKGEPAECHATLRECPVGGDHFSSKAEARSSYESKNEKNIFHRINRHGKNKNDYEKMISKDKRNSALAAGAAAVSIVSITAAIGMSMHEMDMGNKTAAGEYAKTPYSVSVTTHENFGPYSYSAKIMDSNLKETNFDKCVNHVDDSFNTKGDTLVCKTVDEKFQLTVSHGGRGDQFNRASIVVRDGKTNKTITNVKMDHNDTSYIIPLNSVMK